MKRFVLLLCLVGTVAADCPFGGDDSTGPGDENSLVGTWILQSVNNDPLPAELEDGGSVQVITSGQIVVSSNLSFTYTENRQGQSADNVTGVCALTTPPATYTCDPAELPGEESQNNGIAVVNGNSMTLTINDAAATTTRAYNRQ